MHTQRHLLNPPRFRFGDRRRGDFLGGTGSVLCFVVEKLGGHRPDLGHRQRTRGFVHVQHTARNLRALEKRLHHYLPVQVEQRRDRFPEGAAVWGMDIPRLDP